MAALLLALCLAPDYDAQFRSMREGKWDSEKTNERGSLAWSESYVLMALMNHHLATKDAKSLAILVEHGDRIWKSRDDRRAIRDAYRGKVVAGWSSTKYTKGQPYVWAVHTGMIVHPLAEYCRVAGNARWKRLILESVRVFDGQWREGPGKDEGHYIGLALGNARLPFNQMNALGRALLSISRWPDAPAWAGERAKKLLRFFKSRLTYNRATDSYDWSYRAGRGRGEDISHAAINVDFAALGARLGLVFDARDMVRFANTFLQAKDTVSGTGTTGRYAAQRPRWLALTRWDRRVYKSVAARYKPVPKSPTSLLATGLLCLYAAR